MSTVVLKQGRASQRLYLRVEIGTGAADLTGKVLEVKMALPDGSSPQVISGTIVNPQSGGDVGRFYCDVAAADLTALAEPDQVLLVWNFFNTDTSLFIYGQALVDVTL